MITFLALRARLRFWKKRNPLVRAGWFIATGDLLGDQLGTWDMYPYIRRIGYGMILAGIVIGKRKKVVLYSTSVPADQFLGVRVVQNGRSIAAG